MLGREIIEGQKRGGVLGQAGHSLFILGAVFFLELSQRRLRLGTGGGMVDVLQVRRAMTESW